MLLSVAALGQGHIPSISCRDVVLTQKAGKVSGSPQSIEEYISFTSSSVIEHLATDINTTREIVQYSPLHFRDSC